MIRRLFGVCVAGLLAAGGVAADDAKDLQALLRKAGALKSYTFTVDEKPGASAGRPVQGKYQAGQPVYFKVGKIEFFRKGEALAYKDGERWQRSRTGRLSDPLRILGASARVRRISALPHEGLAALAGGLTGVKKAAGKDKGTTVYTGALTAAALKKWAPTEVRSVARSGTAQVSVAKGRVVRCAVTLRLKGRRGDVEVDGTSTITVELSDAGATKVAVPAAARKALE
jgi:hypothetical protein